MKDLDTKKLSSMYDAINGTPCGDLVLLNETPEIDSFLTEGLVEVLGQNPARMLVGLVKREIPSCRDEMCKKRVEELAKKTLDYIYERVTNPMVQRTLSQYKDLSAIARATALYKMLAEL